MPKQKRKRWEESNKPHRLAQEYIARQSRKFSRTDFFRVYMFFKRKDESVLNLLHEFLCSEESKGITMTDLFVRAQKWSTKTQETKITQTTVDDYLLLLGGKRE